MFSRFLHEQRHRRRIDYFVSGSGLIVLGAGGIMQALMQVGRSSAAVVSRTHIVELRPHPFGGAAAIGATGHRGSPSSGIDRTFRFP